MIINGRRLQNEPTTNQIKEECEAFEYVHSINNVALLRVACRRTFPKVGPRYNQVLWEHTIELAAHSQSPGGQRQPLKIKMKV